MFQDWCRERLGRGGGHREGLRKRCVEKGAAVFVHVHGYMGRSLSSGERGARAFVRCCGNSRREECSCGVVVLVLVLVLAPVLGVVETVTSSREQRVRHGRGGSDLEGSRSWCGLTGCLVAIGLITLLRARWVTR